MVSGWPFWDFIKFSINSRWFFWSFLFFDRYFLLTWDRILRRFLYWEIYFLISFNGRPISYEIIESVFYDKSISSWIQFEDISTLNPDEYSTSFEDVINLNGKDLWSLYFNIYLESFQLDSWTPTITINNNSIFTSGVSFISRNESDLMGKLKIMNI